jgi:hypothetical protein
LGTCLDGNEAEEDGEDGIDPIGSTVLSAACGGWCRCASHNGRADIDQECRRARGSGGQLQLGLFNFFAQHFVNWPGFMAASVVILVPIAVLFFLTQKTFIEGITFTGLRG